MEEYDALKVFDATYTTRQTSLLKVLLPLLPPADRRLFASYIRLQESLEILSQNDTFHSSIEIAESDPKNDSDNSNSLFDSHTISIMKQMLPFCEPADKEMLSQLLSAIEQFSELQEMMKMAESLKDIFPQSEAGEGMNIDTILSLFQGMDADVVSDLFKNGGNNETGMDE